MHIATAAAVYGIAEKEVSGAQRTGAKKVNFGIIYGKGEKSLIGDFEDAGQTAEDAINFINMHKKKFPKVWDWLEEQKQIVLQHGQQTTVFGRTRYYDNKDAADIRAAMNNPIQSSASDLTLLSIYNTGKELRDRGMKSVPLLTVHDSIIFEVWIDEFWDVCYIVKQTMEGLRFDWLKTETLVDMKAGANWGSLRKVDLENHCLKVGD